MQEVSTNDPKQENSTEQEGGNDCDFKKKSQDFEQTIQTEVLSRSR